MQSTLRIAGLSLLAATAHAQDEHGQGPVEPGPILAADINLGTHWFGPKIEQKDLVGKVVLVEIWGS